MHQRDVTIPNWVLAVLWYPPLRLPSLQRSYRPRPLQKSMDQGGFEPAEGGGGLSCELVHFSEWEEGPFRSDRSLPVPKDCPQHILKRIPTPANTLAFVNCRINEGGCPTCVCTTWFAEARSKCSLHTGTREIPSNPLAMHGRCNATCTHDLSKPIRNMLGKHWRNKRHKRNGLFDRNCFFTSLGWFASTPCPTTRASAQYTWSKGNFTFFDEPLHFSHIGKQPCSENVSRFRGTFEPNSSGPITFWKPSCQIQKWYMCQIAWLLRRAPKNRSLVSGNPNWCFLFRFSNRYPANARGAVRFLVCKPWLC